MHASVELGRGWVVRLGSARGWVVGAASRVGGRGIRPRPPWCGPETHQASLLLGRHFTGGPALDRTSTEIGQDPSIPRNATHPIKIRQRYESPYFRETEITCLHHPAGGVEIEKPTMATAGGRETGVVVKL